MILLVSRHVCGTRARLFSVAGLILLLHAGSVAATAGSLTFAGIAFSPGSTIKANVPLSAQEKSLAGQGGNAVPANALAILATPSNFDPRKSWPVLVVCSTSDFKRQNRDDLVDFYRRVGLAEGWVLLAGDGPQPARKDTAAWRGAMTLAAIDALPGGGCVVRATERLGDYTDVAPVYAPKYRPTIEGTIWMAIPAGTAPSRQARQLGRARGAQW